LWIGRVVHAAAADEESTMSIRRCLVSLAVLATVLGGGSAAVAHPAGGGDPVVDRLLSRMTLDEKLTLLEGAAEDAATSQYQAGYLPGIPRLGIPSLRLTDGPPGVATRQPSVGMTSTMGVAATFDSSTAYENGVVIGRDARALGQDVVLEPFVNIDRDPATGRGWNTFGEDPLLTVQVGAAEIGGIQSQGTMAQVKHYIAYDGGNGNVIVDQQTLHEIYLAPFAAAVGAGVSSVMCSYNQVNGAAACGNDTTLNRILKGELGFGGFVTSDWGANHGTDFLAKGLDMEMPGAGLGGGIPQYFAKDKLKAALAAGTITIGQIDAAVGRILGQYHRFGLLSGRSKHTVTPEPITTDERTVRATGTDAAVLLKNDGSLPLNSGNVALIGPGAGQTMATGGGGEASTGLASRWIGTADTLRAVSPDTKISYAVADDMTGTVIPASALKVTRTDTATGATHADATIDFTVKRGNPFPAGTAHTWAGTLTAPESGSYWINFGELGTTGTVAIDGKTVVAADGFAGLGPRYGTVKPGDSGPLPSTDGLNNKRAQVTLTAGPHTLAITQTPDVSGAPVQVHLYWVTPSKQRADHDAAVATARKARTAVVFAWSSGNLSAPLPEGQDQLIADIAAVNPDTVVVLQTNAPLMLPWLPKVKAVLNVWFPGDEGGWAIADLLSGHANPGGRLPFTWPAQLTQGVANDPAHPERSSRGVDPGTTTPCTSTGSGPGAVPNCETRYSEGVDVGYRWYDRQGLTPLFPFGYGLSYTSFAYAKLRVGQTRDGLDVTFRVTNTGHRTGDVTPQVYLGQPSHPPAGVQFAVKALAGFDRITLRAGQSRDVTVHVPSRQLRYWSTAQSRWRTATGSRSVSVATSARSTVLSAQTDIH
jgi:beta-glucosidase